MNASSLLRRALAGAAAIALGACTLGSGAYRQHYARDTIADSAVTVTYLGTSSLVFSDGRTSIVIDGFITRPGPEIGLRDPRRQPIDTNERVVDEVLTFIGAKNNDAVFVAHSHHDHALDSPYVAYRTGAILFGSASTLWIGKGSRERPRMQLFDHGDVFSIGDFRITVVRGRHGPMFGPIDTIGSSLEGRLSRPAPVIDFPEGGSFDFLVEHGERSAFVMAGGGFEVGALEPYRADVLFLSIGGLGKESGSYRNNHYRETVGRLRPRLVIPIHWDNFFRPLAKGLRMNRWPVDQVSTTLDYLIERTACDGIPLRLLREYQRIGLPGPGDPVPIAASPTQMCLQ
jgi:L-ascorbate metabolism protein UlaG (beta-lactamase superfamily)